MGATLGIIGSVAGGLLSAGGSIGGSALQGESGTSPGKIPVSTSIPSSDPALAAANFEALAGLGVFDPSVLLAAGPVARITDLIARSPAGGNAKASAQGNLEGALSIARHIAAGNPPPPNAESFLRHPEVLFFLNQAGFGSVEDLLEAETSFQSSLDPILQRGQQTALATLTSRQDLLADRASLLSNLTDLNLRGLIEAERGEVEQRLSERERDVLRGASLSGINPGAQLTELERLRGAPAELEAISRAAALQQASVQSQLASLGLIDQGITLPIQTATATGGARLGANTSFGPTVVSGGNPIGGGVASGLAGLGNTAQTLAFNHLLNAQSAPAVNPVIDLSGGFTPNINRGNNAVPFITGT